MRNGRTGGADSNGSGRREPRFDVGPGPARRGDLDAIPRERLIAEPRRAGPAVSKGRRRAGDPGGSSAPASRRRPRSVVARIVSWALVAAIWGGVGAAVLVGYYARELPPVDRLAVPKRPPNIAILGADGTLLANRGDTGGAAVRLADLPAYLPQAFVAIEDRRFYAHHGIDPLGIARALTRNIAGSGGTQGGSTLTQQLAKNLFLTQERTLSRKIQEAILALWLEHKFSKAQILELYLNRVYFGSGAYGVEAAAQKYFGTPARQVTLAQAAVLAGLMKAPTRLAPNRNPAGASARAAQVIAAMQDERLVAAEAARAALASPARAVRARDGGAVNYAADYVMDVLDDTIGAVEGDIVVSTTIDPALERAGAQALDEELAAKGARYGVSQGALVALAPDGAIRALIGGRDYADSQFNRATAARRQPGSAFKPFVYLTALERGLTPDTVRDDAPINVRGWQPENYSRQYFGPVTLTTALALSLNTVAVRLGLEVGPRAVAATAHRLGLTAELQPNASLALGTSEVSPLDLAGAYAPFANGGFGVQPHVITRIRTAGGRLLYGRKGTGFGRVIDPLRTAMMNRMMQETLLTGTARKAELSGWQAAGKTGTSQDWRDAWFVGYTGALVCDVWVGNDDGSPTRKASGGNLPVDIWSRFMRTALKAATPVPLPGGPAPDRDDAAATGSIRDPASGGPAAPPLDLGRLVASVLGSAEPRGVAPLDPAAAHDGPTPPASVPDRRDGGPEQDDRDLLQRLFGR